MKDLHWYALIIFGLVLLGFVWGVDNNIVATWELNLSSIADLATALVTVVLAVVAVSGVNAYRDNIAYEHKMDSLRLLAKSNIDSDLSSLGINFYMLMVSAKSIYDDVHLTVDAKKGALEALDAHYDELQKTYQLIKALKPDVRILQGYDGIQNKYDDVIEWSSMLMSTARIIMFPRGKSDEESYNHLRDYMKDMYEKSEMDEGYGTFMQYLNDSFHLYNDGFKLGHELVESACKEFNS